MISGRAKIAGVIGWPVTHSLSPRLHNYWLNHYRLDGAYIPLSVQPEKLGEVMRALPLMGLRGVNLTVPHKELVLPFLDTLDEEAKAIGAVNTVTVGSDGSLNGSNTDGYGFLRNVQGLLPAKKNKAVVLGAGGAARAICYALLKEGFSTITVVNRTLRKREELALQLGRGIVPRSWEKREEQLHETDLLVNATSLGMGGNDPLQIDLESLPLTALVTDIVYTPLMTPLLRQAKKRGNPVIDGLGMLLYQAIPGFQSWFGTKPDISQELRQYMIMD